MAIHFADMGGDQLDKIDVVSHNAISF